MIRLIVLLAGIVLALAGTLWVPVTLALFGPSTLERDESTARALVVTGTIVVLMVALSYGLGDVA